MSRGQLQFLSKAAWLQLTQLFFDAIVANMAPPNADAAMRIMHDVIGALDNALGEVEGMTDPI